MIDIYKVYPCKDEKEKEKAWEMIEADIKKNERCPDNRSFYIGKYNYLVIVRKDWKKILSELR